eukprot:snap_masked-scaffold571_size134521-processed-gene-0.4 protein:Tk11007 transcript:snap_masked-scaffold571_size134521-processed-gene-0.4-mRNA-1 annotation:"protein alpha isoform"
MGSEKYKLKWSKYESNILSAFHSLLESETLSDVTLFCEGQTFKAHRLVLAACSTHFESLFSQTSASAPPTTSQFFVVLDGTRADDLQILLHFMYRGEAYLHQDRINSVLRTAEALQVKGLSEGPRNIELNNQNAHGSGNNGRSWSPLPPFGGGNDANKRLKKNEMDEPAHLRDMRHHGSPSPNLHSSGGGISPSSYYAPPPITREPFPMYSGALRNMSTYTRGVRDEHPQHPPAHFTPPPANRSKSPGPPPPPQQGRYSMDKFGSPPHGPSLPSSSVDLPAKDERDSTPISVMSAPEIYEGRSISRGHDSERPPSNKTDTHSPDYERQTPTMSSPLQKTGFPSDSTTDTAAGPSGLPRTAFKTEDHHRLRRSSDPGLNNEAEAGRATPDDHNRPKFPPNFSNAREDIARLTPSSPQGRNNDLRMMEDEAARNQAATSLEQFRRLAQAQEHLMPRRVHQTSGLSALVPGLTASDYMRFAMPVRDPDNGDAISGSGTKLKCPFCERTYGYETNLRAHIRQRHQGIRVSCPYCPRTFTRNNTVRRHVQREHRHLAGRIPTKFGSTRVMPDPITSGPGAVGGALSHHQMPPTSMGSGSPIPTSSGLVGGPHPMDTSGMGKAPHP